jgi:hypothetical protein
MSAEKDVDPEQRFWAIIAWFRRNLLVMIFGALVVLQFLTWRAILNLRNYFPDEPVPPPQCDSVEPCHVIIDRP